MSALCWGQTGAGNIQGTVRLFTLFVFLAVTATCQQPKVDFAADVQPIFETRCQGCHGAQQQMGGLRVDSGEAVLKGGTDGPVIEPGKSAASALIKRVTSSKKGFGMPPVGEPLTAEQIAKLRAWIEPHH
jgi:mono/diheme cytochrome c family protein